MLDHRQNGRQGAPVWFRHATYLVPVVAISIFAAIASAMIAPSCDFIGMAFIVLSTVNTTTLVLSSWSSMIGAAVSVVGRFKQIRGLAAPCATGNARTAILVPIYEEDPVAVFAAVETMRESMLWTSVGDLDVFVLSDTRSEVVARSEEDAHAALCARILDDEGSPAEVSPGRAVHYRRRTTNIRRKAGNVEDFCERWGGAYDFMVVLDADSLMTGRAIAHLVGLMEANPNAGIVQSMCYPIGKDSPFARVQQFGARLYGPMLARGLSFWHGPRGGWWGHNAIIRVSAFMRHCGLPDLPGKAPFGGEILCHDTVESALMLRAGWDVWLSPDVGGSFEQTPTNLVDYLMRERRWCQGNMQHLAALRIKGMKLASYFHIGAGILHYLSAPMFVAFLAAATLVGAERSHSPPTHLGWSAALLATVLALMFVPKAIAIVATVADPGKRASFGGARTLLAGAFCEQAFGILIGPATTMSYLWFLSATLTGRVVKWDAQPRDDRGVRWAEAVFLLGCPLAAGIAGCGMLMACGEAWAWIPILPGLLFGIPFAVYSSRHDLGLRIKARGLFATPEETCPPTEIRAFAEAAERSWSMPTGARAPTPPLPMDARGTMPRQEFRRGPVGSAFTLPQAALDLVASD